MDVAALHPDAPLPEDPEQLRQMIRELLEVLRQTQHQLDGTRQRLNQLLHRLYGPKSERLRTDQPGLFETTPQTPDDSTNPPQESADTGPEPAPKKRRCRPHGRGRLPEHLPRQRIEHDLSAAEKLCPCCQKLRVKIGEEVSEQLDYVPASLYVRQHVRFTYACPACLANRPDGTGPVVVSGSTEPGPQPLAAQPVPMPGRTDEPAAVLGVGADSTTPSSRIVGPEPSPASAGLGPTPVAPPVNANATLDGVATTPARSIVVGVGAEPPVSSVPAAVQNEANSRAIEPVGVMPVASPAPVTVTSSPPPGASGSGPAGQPLIVTADKPWQPIDKGLPGPGLLAYVATSKYVDHLPLYRLERILGRHGVTIRRSTLCDWIAAIAGLLGPLYQVLLACVLRSRVVGCDETRVPVQETGLDKTKSGRLWAYCGDRDHPSVAFDYRPDKSRDGPDAILKEYKGFVQADAANVFDGLFTSGKIVEVGCWAHARRKFHEARTSDASRATQAMVRIKELYAVEDEAEEQIEKNKLSGDAADAVRLRLRQEKTVPKLEALAKWLEQEKVNVLPQSPMGQAIAYVQRHWEALRRFTEHGLLSIDNNATERALRPVAIGRKNYLFFGSDSGGERAAVIYSLTHTCRILGIDPQAYLHDVLERLPTWPSDRLEELLPDRWAARQRAEASG